MPKTPKKDEWTADMVRQIIDSTTCQCHDHIAIDRRGKGYLYRFMVDVCDPDKFHTRREVLDEHRFSSMRTLLAFLNSF